MFHSKILAELNKAAPLQRPKGKSKSNFQNEWVTNQIKNVITKRNKCHRDWSFNKDSESKLAKFRKLRAEVEKSIKIAKKHFFRKFKNCIGDSRATYTFLNELNGTTFSQSSIESISNEKDVLLEAPVDIAETMNTYFANVACNIQASIPDNAGNLDFLMK